MPVSLEHKEDMKKKKKMTPHSKDQVQRQTGHSELVSGGEASHGAGGEISAWCSLTFGAESVLHILLLNGFYEKVSLVERFHACFRHNELRGNCQIFW